MTTVMAEIDVGKSSLDVPVNGEDRRFDNDGTSWRALNAWLKQRDVKRVVPEATGRAAGASTSPCIIVIMP